MTSTSRESCLYFSIVALLLVTIFHISPSWSAPVPSHNDRRSVFDFSVLTHLVCKATTEGKEKEGLDRLLKMGLKLDNVYFDISCPGNYSLLLTSLVSDNYQGARYYLRYLRWRERETGNQMLRSSILNSPNINGETLVDITTHFLSETDNAADIVRLQAFLTLFKKHGGECKKYCDN